MRRGQHRKDQDMDHGELEEMAARGFSAVPATRLKCLADWCWDWCEATGHGAYCSLSVTFRMIDIWWSEYDVIPVELRDRIDELLTSYLPEVLAAGDDSSTASRFARVLRQEVQQWLLPPERWPMHQDARSQP